MQTRFKKGAKIFDIVITAVAGMFSVGVMLYGVGHFGLEGGVARTGFEHVLHSLSGNDLDVFLQLPHYPPPV